ATNFFNDSLARHTITQINTTLNAHNTGGTNDNTSISPDDSRDINNFLRRHRLQPAPQLASALNPSKDTRTIAQPQAIIAPVPFLKLAIGTHNINGLKGSPNKLSRSIEFMKLTNIDIMTFTETNISSLEGAHIIPPSLSPDYHGIWTNKVADKQKGSGLGIVMNHKWYLHHYITTPLSPYIMVSKFLFQNREIWIWTIYNAPSEDDVLKTAVELIKDAIHDQDKELHRQY